MSDLSESGEQLLGQGLEHHRRGDRAAAEAIYRAAVAAAPGEPTGLYLLGLIRFEAGDPEEAERLLERVAQLRPAHVAAWLALGDVRQHRAEHLPAADAYRQASALDGALVAASVGLAQSLLAAGDAAGAAQAADAAIAADPSSAAAHLARAGALAAAKRSREAADAYRRAAEVDPISAAAHLGLSVELLQLDLPAQALPSAERALALDATTALGWFALGTALRRTGEWPRAAQALERALALGPRLRGAALSLGILYAALERSEPAARWLQHALTLEPDDADAHAALSTVHCSVDRFDLGQRHAERALALDPSLTAPHENLARIFARAGDAAAAKRHRDIAYRARCFQLAEAPNAARRVLLLAAADTGNTPHRFLLPADRFTRVICYAEYADARQLAALPDYDVVFNGVGDQDETGPTAANVARFLADCTKPVLNHPDRIARTSRDLASDLFAGVDGLVTPRVARLDGASVVELGARAAACQAGVAVPLIVRPVGSHGGEGARLVTQRSPAEAPAAERDHYAVAFHDYRSPDGLYRKYRIIFVDREPYPYHLAIGPRWMLHYKTAGGSLHPARLAEERAFLEDPAAAIGAAAMQAVREIGQRLDLDFAGVDFAVLPGGEALLFEANATMLVHPEEPDGPLAFKNPFVERIVGAFQETLLRR